MAAPAARMFPPVGAPSRTMAANGRSYTAAANGFVDVPTFDAHVLQANGWVRAGTHAFVGPTSERPKTPVAEQLFFDTSLMLPLVWDGAARVWRNVWTGAPA